MASVGTPARTRASTFGIRVNLGFCGTATSYFWCGGALWGDRMPQSGGSLGQKEFAPPLFLCSFYWWVLYLHGHPRASPPTTAATSGARDLLLLVVGWVGQPNLKTFDGMVSSVNFEPHVFCNRSKRSTS